MTGLLFLAALASLPLIGYPFLRAARSTAFAAFPWPARWSVASALGATVLCAEMVLATSLGLRWTMGLLLVPPVIFALLAGRRQIRSSPAPSDRAAWLWLAGVAAVLGVVAYAAATARATAGDFLLFWGSKGQRFGLARSIDVAFLRDPLHWLMHTDYPPLVTCLYAWGTLVAGRMAWGAALLTMPLFLALTAAAFYGFAQVALGRRLAAEYACLLAALLGLLMISNSLAGDAEPELFFFEALALAALLFAGSTPAGRAAAAIGLAGAALTKVEGTVFAVLVATLYAAWLAPGRRLRVAAALGLPAAAVLAGWVLFCRSHGLLDVYRLTGKSGVTLRWLPTILREIGRFSLAGPRAAAWIVVALLLLAQKRRPSRAAFAVISVAAGFLAFMIYLYSVAAADPSLWIQWSADRLSVTPLLCLFFAAVASEPSGLTDLRTVKSVT